MTAARRFRIRVCSKKAVLRLFVLLLFLAMLGVWLSAAMIRMPGQSHEGPLPPLSDAQASLAEELRADVVHLAETIGPRHVGRPANLKRASHWIAAQFENARHDVERDVFHVQGVECANIIAELPGRDRADEIIVVGAHYDSADDTPAANDNATGVAATLALARRFADAAPARTIRFVAFVNEEPPYFQTERMGSLVYARDCKERGENIVAMISLETIGYYSTDEGSQIYPAPLLDRFYPTTGDFIAFVGDFGSRRLVKDAIASFRKHASFPSQGAALPGSIPGVGWSDHWAFRQVGYPAIMITDTAPFRYPHYHTAEDTPDKLDYESLARVTDGMRAVVEDLANR